MGARIGKAFVVGAALGLIGQILILLAGMIVPADLVVPAAMLLFGILSVILILSGFFPKVMEWGGAGAAITLTGLMMGAAGGAIEEKAKGAPTGKAYFKGFLQVLIVVGIGFVIDAVLGLLMK
ncbi:MAG: SpoVA/SpoVAEb family sporulation membrane protein [Mogibacterium sp.]|nr:SpoVA/SpoVAEb family sporulation membrane protein [Mogibacterium sp.]